MLSIHPANKHLRAHRGISRDDTRGGGAEVVASAFYFNLVRPCKHPKELAVLSKLDPRRRLGGV
jgi:hypothetical protein